MSDLPGYIEVSRPFFVRDVLAVAPTLLGCVLEHTGPDGTVAVRISEVEAYVGERDPGAHSYRGRTARNSTLFGEAGHLYVYFTYGLHHAINLVTSKAGQPYGCLIRAGRVIEGEALAHRRRETSPRTTPLNHRDLARGPGNLAQAFGVTLSNDGDDLFGGSWRFLAPSDPTSEAIVSGPRVGVSGPAGDAIDYPWRFWIAGDPTVSAYRPGAVRKR